MNRYVNKWAYALESALAPDADVLPLPAGAMERLNGPAGAVYALTIAPDQDVLSTAPIEIVLVTVTGPGEFELERGAHGTEAQLWEAGAVIYAVLLAEQLNGMEARFADIEARLTALEGGGEPGGISFSASGGYAYAEDFTPLHASAIPAAEPVEGADGEIVVMSWLTEDGGETGMLYLTIRGEFATSAELPFATMTIAGTHVFERSDAAVSVIGSETSISWSTGGSPIPDGVHTLEFA